MLRSARPLRLETQHEATGTHRTGHQGPHRSRRRHGPIPSGVHQPRPATPALSVDHDSAARHAPVTRLGVSTRPQVAAPAVRPPPESGEAAAVAEDDGVSSYSSESESASESEERRKRKRKERKKDKKKKKSSKKEKSSRKD